MVVGVMLPQSVWICSATQCQSRLYNVCISSTLAKYVMLHSMTSQLICSWTAIFPGSLSRWPIEAETLDFMFLLVEESFKSAMQCHGVQGDRPESVDQVFTQVGLRLGVCVFPKSFVDLLNLSEGLSVAS
jgi:hypothetical protein